MARKIFFITLVGIIGSILLGGCKTSEPTPPDVQVISQDAEKEQHILQATVQITLVRESIRDTKLISEMAEGVGSLVSFDGQVLLVTHNHWSYLSLTEIPDRVMFRDARGEPLLEMSGVEFQGTILYRDKGTLVLQPPDALVSKRRTALVEAARVKAASSKTLQPGDVVQVVRHQSGSELQVELLTAQVSAVNTEEPEILLTLQSADGQCIAPGDSGGGIWFNGRLVGNLWASVREEFYYADKPQEKMQAFTGRSYAAGLTENLLGLVGQSLMHREELPVNATEIAIQ